MVHTVSPLDAYGLMNLEGSQEQCGPIEMKQPLMTLYNVKHNIF